MYIYIYIYGSEDLILSGFLFTLSAGNGGLTGNPSRVLGDVVDSERAHRWASGEPALLAPTLSGRRPPAAKKLVPVRLVELCKGARPSHNIFQIGVLRRRERTF